MTTIKHSEHTYGLAAQDLRSAAQDHTTNGARAALETFYHAFNQRSLSIFDTVWAPDAMIQLNNPLGGIQRGHEGIRTLYQRIFEGPARVWVEFYDIVEYIAGDTVVFAGRERGEFALDGVTVPLAIRTTRVLQYLGAELGWRQVHHHGSIDDADLLQRYQAAVRGEAGSKKVTTIAQIEVKSTEILAFRTATETLLSKSRKETGVQTFDLYVSTEYPNRFLFHEIFNSQATLDQHRQATHTQMWFAAVTTLLEGQPNIQNLQVSN